MKKQKRLLSILLFMIITLSSCPIFAADISSYFKEIRLSDEYLEYLELSDEEKINTLIPRTYEVQKNVSEITNPLRLARMITSSATTKYSLRNIIPENMVIKNQERTNSCWTFSSLAALESTLALKDYNNGKNPVVYDFSERHMEYATSETFKDGIKNEIGFNREVGTGGNFQLFIPYLTNGTGAIAESEMPFENNENKIYISEIKNKTVLTHVKDVVTFPSYEVGDDKTQIIQQMKNHIKNHGAIDVCIHGASPTYGCFNIENGAIYCDHKIPNGEAHAVAIIGWDDTYSKNNFAEGKTPTKDGAWIIKNSWGTELERYTLAEMKTILFQYYKEQCIAAGWATAEAIPDEAALSLFEQMGYTIDGNEVYYPLGDDGFMYISYEDYNVYLQMSGIIDAESEVGYENLYQYDEFGGVLPFGLRGTSKLYLATIFDRKSSGKEYLTEISINAPETYTCKVYVNPNGTSKAKSDLKLVQLKSGETETFDAGYHTIEFLEPVQITGSSFVVVVEIQGAQTNYISAMLEINSSTYGVSTIWDNVKLESGKCFVLLENDLANDGWIDTSTLYSVSNGGAYSGDTTIKAFTTSKILENIKVTTPPTKTTYVKGQNFDKTGMIVKANYANGESKEIKDYTISNGTGLKVGQTSVTVSYEGKTTTQPINVVENKVESIKIITPPTKKEYFAGEDFDSTGMVVEATYTDGTKQKVTDYTIKDGKSLKNEQKSVTIEFEGKTTIQAITIKENKVVKLEIVQAPKKVKYVVGQNFNSEGMIVKATYENKMEKEITNYTIVNGQNLKQEQKSVTIEFEGQKVIQPITVEEKAVIAISVKTTPSKKEYIQNNEELNLNGGVIEIEYNDNTKEELSMTSEEITVTGFDNKKVGTQTIVLTYQGKTAQFNVEVKEEPKPENSKFDNVKGNVTRVRAYSFTDSSKSAYTVLNVEVKDIVKASINDKVEYYYYLSSNQKESDITDWVKVKDVKETENGLSFEINTLDISNYQQIANAENIYLYIKEVAIRNEKKSEEVTNSILLEVKDINIEEYVDGEKKKEEKPGTTTDSTPGEEADDTLVSGTIPNAGKNILLLIIAIMVLVIGRISYLRYKDIKLK